MKAATEGQICEDLLINRNLMNGMNQNEGKRWNEMKSGMHNDGLNECPHKARKISETEWLMKIERKWKLNEWMASQQLVDWN